jgi:polyhydroxyalkanoate synthesis regulator phasin
MPSSKSKSGGARSGRGSRSVAKPADASNRRASTNTGGDGDGDGDGDGQASLTEQLAGGIIKPLGLVVLTRDRIQEILDDAAARGRVTRSDANELVAELVDRGRQQTDQLLADIERLFGVGFQQLGSAATRARRSESLDLLLRSADRARRTVSVGQGFPILGYDELTAAQVQSRLDGLSPPELRRVRDHERRHANRKSVLAAIDKHLTSD